MTIITVVCIKQGMDWWTQVFSLRDVWWKDTVLTKTVFKVWYMWTTPVQSYGPSKWGKTLMLARVKTFNRDWKHRKKAPSTDELLKRSYNQVQFCYCKCQAVTVSQLVVHTSAQPTWDIYNELGTFHHLMEKAILHQSDRMITAFSESSEPKSLWRYWLLRPKGRLIF